jgi:phosphoserine phosphatase RsbU/P
MSSEFPVIPTLELVSKERPTRIFELNKDVLTIGRDRQSDVLLDDHRVSSWHARLERRPDGLFAIEDTESRNHTYLDGQKLEPSRSYPLKDGSRIRICEFTLVYQHQIVKMAEGQKDDPTIIGMLEDMSSLHLASRVDRSSVVLRAVLEINRLLGGTTDLNEVLARALEELFAIFRQAECGFILTKEPDGKLNPRAARQRNGQDPGLTLSRRVLDRVFLERKGLIVSDVETEGAVPITESLSVSGIRTALCAPILGQDGVPIGFVQLDSRASKVSFGAEDLELLAAVCVPMGVVVENHQLLREKGALAAASEIQTALLPRQRPNAHGFVFWEHYQPAQEVGGDFYDYIPTKKATDGSWERFAVALGDVSGKGMPAALLMARFGAEGRHLVRTGAAPEAVADELNRTFLEADLHSRFVTLILYYLDVASNRVSFVNAGHLCPMIRRRTGAIEVVADDERGTPLGIDPNWKYQSSVLELAPGDVVVSFTDGVTDALDPQQRPFGIEGVRAVVEKSQGGAAQLGDALMRAVRAHAAGRIPFDDIAIVCFGRA